MMKKKILIIEDDVDSRTLEKDLLEAAGFEVLEAADTKTGIAIAKKEELGLIIMDIRLPYKARGIGTATLLRANEHTRDVPIVFVTAYDMIDTIKRMRHITNFGYITKPIDVGTFAKEIAKHIKGSGLENRN